MAFYRQIYSTFWTDTKVNDDFSPEDKYFYLYLLTNAYTSLCGCYEISPKQMSGDLGYNEDTVCLLLKRMEENHKVIRYSPETKEVLLLNWSKYNWSSSPNFIRGIEEYIPCIKNEEFKEYVIGKLEVHKIKSKEKKKTSKSYDEETDSRRLSPTVGDCSNFPVSVSDYSLNKSSMVKEEKEMGVQGEEEKPNDLVPIKKQDDYQSQAKEVLAAWNAENLLPEIKRCSPDSERGKMLVARIKEYGLEDVLTAVHLAGTSKFLLGQNWFDFSWFVKPNNFIKVLEGKYNRESTPETASTGNVFFDLARELANEEIRM